MQLDLLAPAPINAFSGSGAAPINTFSETPRGPFCYDCLRYAPGGQPDALCPRCQHAPLRAVAEMGRAL